MGRVATLAAGVALVVSVPGMTARAADMTLRASWYGPGFVGRTMANGERFDQWDPTVVASRDIPLGTPLILTNPANGRSVRAVVQDRGPVSRSLGLDVSRAIAHDLDFVGRGTTWLEVDYAD